MSEDIEIPNGSLLKKMQDSDSKHQYLQKVGDVDIGSKERNSP